MLLSGQIRSYCKKLTASRTNRIVLQKHDCCGTNRIVVHKYVTVAPMRCCVITCCLDQSDRIGIEMCYEFHCAAVSSSDIFGTAVSIALYWSIAPKLSRQSFFVQKIKTAVQKNIRRRHSGPVKHIARLYANTIRFPYSKLRHSSALEQLSRVYALRYDLSYSNQAFCNPI